MKAEDKKNDTKQLNIEKFQYFHDDFYGFLSTLSRGKTTKKVRFKNRVTKDFTPETAFLIKSYIDNTGLKYNTKQIRSLLDNHNNIQSIIDNIRKYKKL